MRRLIRASCVLIAVGAAVAIVSTSSAQTPPAAGSNTHPTTGQAPAPPPVAPANPTTPSPADTRTQGAPPPTTPTPESGSAAAGSADGSAAPAAGSAAGSGSAAAPPKDKVVPVDCGKVHVDLTVKVTGGKFDIEPVAPLPTDGVVKFELPSSDDVENYPKGDPGLHATAGTTTCLKFTADGEYRFHSGSHPIENIIYVRPWYDIMAERPVDDYAGTFWMPTSVNGEAEDSDMMFYSVLALSAFFFVAIAAAVIYFVVKYRHRPGHKPQPSPAHNDALEITWTIIPTIICVFLFYYGWHSYVRVVTPPAKAVEVQVQAKRWAWNFVHQNGASDSDLHIPPNTPVRFVMTSQDVLHSFYIPVMRVKQDIVPRRYTYAWVYATRPGTYRLNCAEYCGTNHSQMGVISDPIPPSLPNGRRAVVVVHNSLEEYERYLNEKAVFKGTPEEFGRQLFDKKGCNACHTIDGTQKIGPSWKIPGDWGKDISVLDSKGNAITVKDDENYLRESILFSLAKSRPGFPNSMPVFDGQLKENEVAGLIAFIKSLRQ